MKYSYVIISYLFFIHGSTLTNEWWSRVIFLSKDKDVWKVLLRLDATTRTWTDFKKKGSGSGFKKANDYAFHFLPEQIHTSYLKYNGKPITLRNIIFWQEEESPTYRSKDYIHFIPIDFIRGAVLFNKARTKDSIDFAWVSLDNLLTQQAIKKPHKEQGATPLYSVDEDIMRILEKYKNRIYQEIIGLPLESHQMTIQQQPQTPPLSLLQPQTLYNPSQVTEHNDLQEQLELLVQSLEILLSTLQGNKQELCSIQ